MWVDRRREGETTCRAASRKELDAYRSTWNKKVEAYVPQWTSKGQRRRRVIITKIKLYFATFIYMIIDCITAQTRGIYQFNTLLYLLVLGIYVYSNVLIFALNKFYYCFTNKYLCWVRNSMEHIECIILNCVVHMNHQVRHTEIKCNPFHKKSGTFEKLK